ncbi:MAG TPA: ABC transporter ATP-binding protein [Ktedonobacterales bacterium]
MRANYDDTQAITVEHLVKRYRRAQNNAVDDISFSVRRGEIFGLLGPNGAGKTTAIGILTTMVRPTGGRATIGGVDVVRNPIGAKQRIAVVPQRNNLDRSLRVREILTYHAAYHGVPRAEREARANVLLEEFGLSERRNEKLGWLSGGLEQRVMLARALMHEPGVLFLDEPTNNLDPQARLFLWERIRTLHEQGITIVLTTHDMEEADRLCERIAIVDHGRLLALDTPDGLKRLIPGGTKLDLRLRVPAAVAAGHAADDGDDAAYIQGARFRETLESLPGVMTVEQVDGQPQGDGAPETLAFRVYASAEAGAVLASATQVVLREHAELLDLRFARPSLEDVFIYLTGRDLRS